MGRRFLFKELKGSIPEFNVEGVSKDILTMICINKLKLYLCVEMQRFIHISLILIAVLAIFLETEKSAVYSLWFFSDNDSFTEAYCLNLDHPELDCHGSCRLSSELTESSDLSTNPAVISASPTYDVTYYFSEIAPVSIQLSQEKVLFFATRSNYSFEFIDSVFHPPLV